MNIGRSVFYGCSNLKYHIEGGLKYLGNDSNPYVYLLGVENNITTATIDDGCRIINSWVFAYCKNLTSVVIGDGVRHIGEYAFRSCTSLTSVVIPEGMTSISDYAFYHCSSLASVVIPESVMSIGREAFNRCYDLASVYYKGAASDWEKLTIDLCNGNLTNATFYYYSENRPVEEGNYWHYDENNRPTNWGHEHSYDDGVVTEPTCTTAGYTTRTCATCGDTYTDDEVAAFGHSYNDGVVTEPTCTIAGYTTRTCATCGDVYTSEIPATGVHVDDGRGDCSFCNYPIGSTVGIVYEVVDVEVTVVRYEGTDTDVRIADTYKGMPVTSIGSDAFASCSILTSVVIGDNVITIGDRAFLYCSSLTNVVIPDGVITIGKAAFLYCSSLTSITVDENNAAYQSVDGNLYTKDGKTLVQYAIGKKAKSFTIPDSVTAIGLGAFGTCKSLTSVAIPDSITSIGEGAFVYCSSLTGVVIPDSVTSIGEGAFAYCSSLKGVVIGDGATMIGYGAFADCSSLTRVYYKGTAEEWSNISIDESNGNLTNATCYYYSETEPTTTGNYWYYDENNQPTIWNIADSHKHSYASEYSRDNKYHWYGCTTCGDVKDKEEHTDDGNGNCSVCGYPRTYEAVGKYYESNEAAIAAGKTLYVDLHSLWEAAGYLSEDGKVCPQWVEITDETVYYSADGSDCISGAMLWRGYSSILDVGGNYESYVAILV